MVDIVNKKKRKPAYPGEVVTDVQVGEDIAETPEQEEQLLRQREMEAARAVTPKSSFEVQQELQQGEEVAAAVEAEQSRIIQEEPLQRRQLDPTALPGSNIPVVGAIASTQSNLMFQSLKKSGVKLDEGILDPETLRTMALTEIERKVYEDGLTASESFGAWVESIPGLGKLTSWATGDLVELPTGNIIEMTTNVRKYKRVALKTAEEARAGLIPPELAKEEIEQTERDIQELESRIKYVLNFSSQLRFNSDKINTLETELLNSRQALRDAKLSVARDAGGVEATDAQIAHMLSSIQTAEAEGDFEF